MKRISLKIMKTIFPKSYNAHYDVNTYAYKNIILYLKMIFFSILFFLCFFLIFSDFGSLWGGPGRSTNCLRFAHPAEADLRPEAWKKEARRRCFGLRRNRPKRFFTNTQAMSEELFETLCIGLLFGPLTYVNVWSEHLSETVCIRLLCGPFTNMSKH